MNTSMICRPRTSLLLIFATACAVGGVSLSGAQEKPATPAKNQATPELAKAMKAGVESMKRGDWKRAATAWEEAVKLAPENAGAWANLGKVQLQQKDAKSAITSLEKAVLLQPTLADAWLTLGMAYVETGATMRAVSCLTRAAHENSGDARTRNSLAIVLKKNGWAGAAESELQKALDLDPRYAEAHFNLAVMYLERRPPSLEMARRHYDAARQLGSEADAEMEAQLAGNEPAVDDSPPPPAQKLPPASKDPTKSTRPKS